MNERLHNAYRATSYVVDGPEGRFVLRVDETSPPLDDLLVRHNTRCWAFVTACNPGSVLLSAEENRRRQAELEAVLREARYTLFAGQGVGEDDWLPEASVLILGITPEDAAALGRHFGQNAILTGEACGPARLLWL
jgi:hypothetical protein